MWCIESLQIRPKSLYESNHRKEEQIAECVWDCELRWLDWQIDRVHESIEKSKYTKYQTNEECEESLAVCETQVFHVNLLLEDAASFYWYRKLAAFLFL
ncbi:hypothetical protein ECANGB1_1712 [Enterospora canceri]|uniref:Uncharacterized protein n=1 Tax=Enterospora canceri TaxID=1081671 RepID=A0A1Y1S997_9MICR|nr:hypothetical protein ECANGB1_1712 [Enterospora canceri]